MPACCWLVSSTLVVGQDRQHADVLMLSLVQLLRGARAAGSDEGQRCVLGCETYECCLQCESGLSSFTASLQEV